MNARQSLSTVLSRLNMVRTRTKIVVMVLALILFSSGSLVWYSDRDARTVLRQASEEMGSTLATGLASQSLDYMPSRDYITLNSLIKSYVNSVKDISYIYILDASSKAVAQASKGTDFGNLPAQNETNGNESPRIKSFQVDKRSITDIAVSIPGGNLGSVHVGLNDAVVNNTVTKHTQHIVFWLVLVLALGVTMAYVLSYILTYPISVLAAEATELGRGAFKQRHRKWAADEIGSLGRAFDKMSREIARKEEMRNQLLAKVLSAQEDERKRIARELHDHTSQSLTSLMVSLKVLENAPDISVVRARLVDLRALAHQTLDDIHNLAMELRPNVLDDLGLGAALQKYTAEYSAKTGINVDLHIGDIPKERLPSDVETAAYRITQEALSNVTRHAQAKNASVIVACQDSRLTLIIEDDGHGFNVNEAMNKSPEQKLGLYGMYERASLVGGTLTIESMPGSGTSVFLEAPLKPREVGVNE